MTQAATAYQDYREVRFFGSLNGLRFVCIALVLWHHAPIWTELTSQARIWSRGFVGVDFFFVLSGFLITTLFLREEARNGRISLRGFYWRRILRIFPVYLLLVVLLGGYWVLVKGRDDLAPLLPYYVFFLANFLKGDIPLLAPTWSLSVEEQYYMLWPLMLLLLPQIARLRGIFLVTLITICVLSAMGWLAFLGLRPIETEYAVWVLPAAGYGAILLGSLVAVILHQPEGFAVLYRLLGFSGAPLLAFAALLLALMALPVNLTGWPNFVMHSLMAICLITIVLREDHALRPALAWRPVARIGEISYGVYLYHLIGLHIGTEVAGALGWTGVGHLTAVIVLYLGATYVISEISFRTYERFFLAMK